MTEPIKTIAAIGAGRMGRGIAQVFAYRGYETALIDFKRRPADESRALLGRARDEIAGNLAFLAELGLLDGAQAEAVLARVRTYSAEDCAEALAGADVVFEGVTELIEVKREAFGRLCPLARADAILASTTSTIKVDALAQFVTRPERFLNAHWLNPAYLIPLVEVSPGRATADAAIAAIMTLLTEAGKVPVRCAPTPGFIVPRIQTVVMNEAARIVEEGVASAADVDRAIRAGFGVRYPVLGVLEFIDWGGLDILYYAGSYLAEALNDARYAPPSSVVEKMQSGKRGMHAGEGYYDFRGVDLADYQRTRLARFVGLLRHLDLMPAPAKG